MKNLPKGKYLYISIAIVLLSAFGAWRLIVHSDLSDLQTLTVHPQPFAQQIAVSGTVEAAQDVDLGFAQSGRITHTYVNVGDMVQQGALIAEMDNGDLRAALAQRRAALSTAQAQLASLQAGTRSEQLAVTQSQVQGDETALAQANAALANAIQNAYTQSDDAVHNKVDQFFANPRSYAPSLVFSTSNVQLELTLKSERAAMEQTLADWQKSIAALASDSDLAAVYDTTNRNLALVVSFLSDANAVLNTASSGTVSSATLSSYISAVATARANVSATQSALTAAMTAMRTAQDTLEKDRKNLVLQQAGATQQDLDAQEARVQAAAADVQAAQAQLGKTIITAPFAGTITRMDAKVGEIVSPTASEIAMISTGLFQIKTYIPEVQISGAAVGNTATTTLDAYGETVPFAAKVIAIDPAETVVNGVSTYKTTLQFLQADARIRSGMTASVIITTSLVPGALVIPQGAIFQKEGASTVQLLKNGRVIDEPVQTAVAASFGNIQVTQGLHDGDVVILNPDTAK